MGAIWRKRFVLGDDAGCCYRYCRNVSVIILVSCKKAAMSMAMKDAWRYSAGDGAHETFNVAAGPTSSTADAWQLEESSAAAEQFGRDDYTDDDDDQWRSTTQADDSSWQHDEQRDDLADGQETLTGDEMAGGGATDYDNSWTTGDYSASWEDNYDNNDY